MRESPSPSVGISTSDADRSGPYSPRKDPTVIVLGLIAVGSFLLLISGAGSTLTGGSGGGPVFPLADSEDDPNEVVLSVEVNRSEVRPNESVAVTVTDGNDNPVRDATVVADDGSATTGADGRATVRLERSGRVTLRAYKSGNESRIYRDASVEVVVSRIHVDLAVSTNVSTVRVDDPVAVTVRRADTGEPVSGHVTVGNRSVDVEDGQATVRFDAAGEYSLTANRSATSTERFDAATTTVTVERLSRDLSVRLFDETMLVGETTWLQVRRADTGEGVPATVTVGDRTVETSSRGFALVSNLSAGEYDARATADPTPRVAFEAATARLTVERETVPLSVTTNVTAPRGGDPVSVRVTRADSGASVNASVQVDGTTLRTGDDGRVVVRFDRPGNRSIVATRADTRAETFRSASAEVDVRAPWFEVDASLTAEYASGASFTTTATVRNTGNEPGTTYVRYTLAGRPLANRTVSLAPGESVTVEFGPYLTPPLPATYGQTVTVRTDVASGGVTVRASNVSVVSATRSADGRVVSRWT